MHNKCIESEYILFNRFGINKFEYLTECTMYSLFILTFCTIVMPQLSSSLNLMYSLYAWC